MGSSLFGCSFSTDDDCVMSPVEIYFCVALLAIMLISVVFGWVRDRDNHAEYLTSSLYLALMLAGSLLMASKS